jgi:hypothetical protein
VDVRIPEDILERLEAIAKGRGISRHQVIRKALAEFVERNPASAEREPLDAKRENKRLTTRQVGIRNATCTQKETP